MYSSELERSYIERFFFTQVQGPVIHTRFYLPSMMMSLVCELSMVYSSTQAINSSFPEFGQWFVRKGKRGESERSNFKRESRLP